VPVIRGVVSTTVPDSEHKVYLGGIPTALNEMQVPHPQTELQRRKMQPTYGCRHS
jgi:hypothetical protein